MQQNFIPRWSNVTRPWCKKQKTAQAHGLKVRYHGRWIDSVWKLRSYSGALKENPINLYIFWKLNSHRIQSYLWNFINKVIVVVTLKEIIYRNTALLKLVRFHTWIIEATRLTLENAFSHIILKKRACDFPDVGRFFFYTLLNFDIFNVDSFFYLRGHNFETKAKIHKAQHQLSKEVFWNIPANFQPIPLDDVCKRT